MAKNMSKASFTMDESGVVVFERNNDVIVVPEDLADLLPVKDGISNSMSDEAWEILRDIVKQHKEENDAK